MNQYDVVFEQNNLNLVQDASVLNHEFNLLPTRQVNINKLARRDLSIITSAEYSQKQIRVFMHACAGSREETEAVITLIKQLCQPVNGDLQVLQNDVEVKYTATMNEFNIEWEASNAYIEIVFIASDPLGTTTSALTFANFAHNAAQTTATGVFQGSGVIEPTINIVINSISGGGVINILNARTNQGITISQPLSSGDILIIDSKAKRATLNNGLIDFSGLFPTFAAGTQQILITDTYTSRTSSVNVDYFGSFV